MGVLVDQNCNCSTNFVILISRHDRGLATGDMQAMSQWTIHYMEFFGTRGFPESGRRVGCWHWKLHGMPRWILNKGNIGKRRCGDNYWANYVWSLPSASWNRLWFTYWQSVQPYTKSESFRRDVWQLPYGFTSSYYWWMGWVFLQKIWYGIDGKSFRTHWCGGNLHSWKG